MPYPFEIATGDVRMSGVLVTVDSTTKCAENIERIQIAETVAEHISYDSDDGRREYYNNGF
jgi:calcineurin-like phosphoesterase